MEQNLQNQEVSPIQPQDITGRTRNLPIIFSLVLVGIILLVGAFYAGMRFGLNKQGQPIVEVPQKQEASLETSEKLMLGKLIKNFEETLDLTKSLTNRQEKFLSFFTDPKTSKEQQEKNQLFCEGSFPCLWVSTSSLTGVSRYELTGLQKISDGRYQAYIKEWVINYSAPDGKYIETGQRTNPLIIVKEGDKWLIESYGSGGKYQGVYAGLEFFLLQSRDQNKFFL